MDWPRAVEHAVAYLGQDAIGDLMDVDYAFFLMTEELVDNGDGDDAADTLAQLIRHLGVIRSSSLQTQERGDGLQIVLHAVMDLLDHRRLDLQLLLILQLVSDILNRHDRASRYP